MTTNIFRGLLVATAAIAIVAACPALAADAPAQKLSSAVSKQFTAAQKAAQTQDWATAKTQIDAAAQASGRTPYDDYEISQFNLMIDFNLKDMVGAAEAARVSADSPAQPEADKGKNLKLAVQLSLQAQQFDKALTYAKNLAALNVTDQASLDAVFEAYYFNKDFPNAAVTGQKSIDAAVAAKQKPDHNSLEMLLDSQVQAKDQSGAQKTLEALINNYNDPNDWQQMIDVTMGTPQTREVDYVWLGRLLYATGAPVSSSDAAIFGQSANHLTFFGDAQTALKNGATGYPDPAANANKDKQSMPAQIAAGQKANAQYSAKLAEALYGYGMYPEAETAARLAMSKGGATDPSEAPMVLGQALVAQGKYDDAIAAFGQVTGGSAATPRVARLWVDYANIKKTPPATASAAPAPAAAAK